jgi:hypothetical protein
VGNRAGSASDSNPVLEEANVSLREQFHLSLRRRHQIHPLAVAQLGITADDVAGERSGAQRWREYRQRLRRAAVEICHEGTLRHGREIGDITVQPHVP